MKPILFIDFDGTLCHDRFWRSEEPGVYAKIQEVLFTLRQSLIKDWMLGRQTSEEINKILAERLGVSYDSLWKGFVSDCQKMFVKEDTLNKIAKLRKKYTVILITDNMDCFSRFTVPALKLNNYFDQIVNSSDEKRLKRDENGSLLREIIEKNNSSVSDCIIIDNSEKVCDLFTQLGGKSLLVTKEKDLDYWLDHHAIKLNL